MFVTVFQAIGEIPNQGDKITGGIYHGLEDYSVKASLHFAYNCIYTSFDVR